MRRFQSQIPDGDRFDAHELRSREKKLISIMYMLFLFPVASNTLVQTRQKLEED